MSDVFDTIDVNATSPKGDVFDQISPSGGVQSMNATAQAPGIGRQIWDATLQSPMTIMRAIGDLPKNLYNLPGAVEEAFTGQTARFAPSPEAPIPRILPNIFANRSGYPEGSPQDIAFQKLPVDQQVKLIDAAKQGRQAQGFESRYGAGLFPGVQVQQLQSVFNPAIAQAQPSPIGNVVEKVMDVTGATLQPAGEALHEISGLENVATAPAFSEEAVGKALAVLFTANMGAQAPQSIQQRFANAKASPSVSEYSKAVGGSAVDVLAPYLISKAAKPIAEKSVGDTIPRDSWALPPSVQLKAPGARFEVTPKGDIFDTLNPTGGRSEESTQSTKSATQSEKQTQAQNLIKKVNPVQTLPDGTKLPGGGNISYTDKRTGFTVENLPPSTSAEHALPLVQEKLANDLVPAIKDTSKGLLKATTVEQVTHTDVLKANGIDPKDITHFDPRRGFWSNMTEKFYTRKEAQELTGIKGTADAGGLDSTDLPRAQDNVRDPYGQRDLETSGYASAVRTRQSAETIEGMKPSHRLYSGLTVLDPEFWKGLGVGEGVKTDGQMLYNRVRNKLGEASSAWKMLDTEGFRKVVAGGGKVTVGDVKKWVEENGPKVEVRKFGNGTISEGARRRNQIQHEIETAGFVPQFSVNTGEVVSVVPRVGGVALPVTELNPRYEDLIKEYNKNPSTEQDFGQSQSHWSFIAPKSESSMPGYTEIAVVKPYDKTKADGFDLDDPTEDSRGARIAAREAGVQFPSSHSFPPNTLGFVRGYMETTPEGKKVFHVIEVQSDWAQQAREQKELATRENMPINDQNYKSDYVNRNNEPLLRDYERLALKAAIDHARSEGADAIAISDAETAMMTEGHDRLHRNDEYNVEEPTKEAALENLRKGGEWNGDKENILEIYQMSDGAWKVIIKNNRPISQAPGMRLHYDRTLPKIAEELTGEKGKRVEFGEHKMAFLNDYTPSAELPKKPREDLIFRDPSGQPKTSISARQFDLRNIPQRPPAIMGKMYGGLPIFDPDLWGQTADQLKAAKDKFAEYLARKGNTVAADATRNSASKQFVSKDVRKAAILGSTTAKRFDRTQEQIPQPGEKLSFGDRTSNFATRVGEAAREADKVVNPMDVIYDWMDGGKGKYNGPLMENIRKPLDSDFNDELNLRQQLLDPIRDLITKNKMGNRESGRIGVYLNTLQQGGRERMVSSGIQPVIIDNIVKSLTPAERQVAQSIRAMYDQTLPLIQKVAKEVDGIEIKPVANYFSWEREWRKYKPEADELATPQVPKTNPTVDDLLWPGLEPVHTRTKPGSLESRIPNAKTPIKVNAFEIVDRYVRDASHYISMRKHLKEISEIVRSDEFADKYGDKGQELIMEHLNTIARQGRYKRNAVFDTLRRLTSRGVIAFRIPSQLVHLANIPLAQQRTGVEWWNKGLQNVLSEEGQAFLHKNFAETFERGGGEPALREIEEGKLGKQGAYQAFGKSGFWLQRRIDQLNAQATVMGMYLRQLKEQGKDHNDFATLPVDKAAVEEARVLARRAVASPIYKDVPPIIGRGGSIGRSLLQFQNTFLDQWSNFRYDLIHAGLPQAFTGHPKLAMQMTAALFAMLMTETAVKYGYKQGLNKLTGNKSKEDDTFQKTLQHEALRRIPGMGQLESEVVYGETGVPSVDVATGPLKEGYKYLRATDKGSRTLNATRAIADVAEASGVLGTSQVADIVEGEERHAFFKSHQQRLEDQTHKPINTMTLSQRISAERKYKQTAEPMSKDDQAKSAERSIANITKRGEEVAGELDKPIQKYVKDNNFTIPGYDNKLKISKTEVYLTDDELAILHSYIKDEYTKAIATLQKDKGFSKLPPTEQKEYFNSTLMSARKFARERLIDQMEKKKDMSSSTTEPDKKANKPFSIFNP